MRTGNASRQSRVFLVAVASSAGVLLNRWGAWIVHHDGINYWLRDAGLGLVSDAAEVAFALGPVLWVGGALLALPLLLGWMRQVISFHRLVALQMLAYATLVCGLAATAAFASLGLLTATVFLWIQAMVFAAVSPAQPSPVATPRRSGRA